MEEFISEHGGVLINGIISVFVLTILWVVVFAIGNMNAQALASIMGK